MNKELEAFNKVLEEMELRSMDRAKIKSYAKDLYKAAYTLGAEGESKEDNKDKSEKKENKSGKSIVELAQSKRKI